MSIRNLDFLFDPHSVAVFGASERPASVGATVWRNLREGGFCGPRWAVNPKHTQLGSEPCHADVASLPEAPDLAVICTPPATVPRLRSACCLAQRSRWWQPRLLGCAPACWSLRRCSAPSAC